MGIDKKSERPSDNAAIAKGAGLAALSQTGAVVEALGLVVFTWLYPTAVVGLFFTLWAALKVLTAVAEFAMTTAQQRFTPAARTRLDEARILKAALAVALTGSIIGASIITAFAPAIAGFLEGGTVSDADMVVIVRVYAWALPLWTLVEVLTASVRAQHTFGPEIRVRVFYEQALRLVLGVTLFFLGLETFGLFFAHVVSIFGAAALALRLAAKYYDLAAFRKARVDARFLKGFLSFSLLMMPANFVKQMFIVGSVIIVNKALGAEASAIFGLGRHLSSVLQLVHLSFEYVMAPFASFKNAFAKREEVGELYQFSTRLMAALVLPFGTLLIFASRDILSVFNPAYSAATGVIIIFTAGRILEALAGPSAAIIEMLGNKLLPLINNALGLATLLVLQYYLKIYGVYGIALATVIGFNVTSLLSLAEAFFLYRLLPYAKSTLRPLGVSFAVTGAMVVVFIAIESWPHALHILIGVTSVYVALKVLVRYGLSERDARALGRIGRWFRRLKPQTEDFIT